MKMDENDYDDLRKRNIAEKNAIVSTSDLNF